VTGDLQSRLEPNLDREVSGRWLRILSLRGLFPPVENSRWMREEEVINKSLEENE
jgi:hypothetical protein